jgi:hypothetical protein
MPVDQRRAAPGDVQADVAAVLRRDLAGQHPGLDGAADHAVGPARRQLHLSGQSAGRDPVQATHDVDGQQVGGVEVDTRLRGRHALAVRGGDQPVQRIGDLSDARHRPGPARGRALLE